MKTLRTLLLLGTLWTSVLGADMGRADEQPPHSGFLSDYTGFVEEKDSELEHNLVWYKPGADSKTILQPYNKFMLDTVTVFPHPGAEYKGLKPEELARLSEYFLNSLTKQLTEGGYQVVTEPGPGVARVRVAITDVVPVNRTLNTFSTFVPQARLLSGVVGATTDSNMFVGQIAIEAEVLDAQSNERLMAVMARQAGKKYVPFVGRGFASASKWGQIEQNMDYWTAKWRKRLDTAHGKSGETAAKAGS
jgi:Protein of unknown function (DUF3313)